MSAAVHDTSGPVISLDQVRKMYRTGTVEFEALRGIDLTIERGEYLSRTPRPIARSTVRLDEDSCLG